MRAAHVQAWFRALECEVRDECELGGGEVWS